MMNDYAMSDHRSYGDLKNRNWFRRTAVLLAVVLALSAVLASTVYVSADPSDFTEGPDVAAGELILEDNKYIEQNWLERVSSVASSALTAPTSFDDYYRLAEIAISRSDYPAALQHIDTCLNLVESNPLSQAQVWLVKGCLETLVDEDSAALESLTEAAALNPKLGDTYLVQVQILIEREEWNKAAEVFERYFERSAEINTRMYAAMGELKLMLGDYRSAAEYYSLSVNKHNALDPEILVNRGGCYAQLGAYHEAVEDFAMAAELGAEPLQYVDNLVLCQLLLKDYTAVLEIGESLAADQRSAELLQNMGVAAMALEKMAGAETYFSQSLALNSELPSVYYYRGICRLSLERYDEACRDFSMSIARGEALQLSYYNRGVSYLKNEQYNEAQTDLVRTVQTDEDPLITKSARAILQQLGGT